MSFSVAPIALNIPISFLLFEIDNPTKLPNCKNENIININIK